MRFRSVIQLSFIMLLVGAPGVYAQKRIASRVNPNAEAVNGTADIYDPASGTITAASGGMTVAREQHVAVPLYNGKVYIAGGYNNEYLKSAELFDPETNSFTATTSLNTTRAGAAAVRLEGGSVLVAGGYSGTFLSTAELYDPISQKVTFFSTALNVSRQNATATLLGNNTVLIAGGFNGGFLNSAEIFNPGRLNFAVTGSMVAAREGHTATRLPDGTVLITGGCNSSDANLSACDSYLNTAEIYNPSTNTFTATSGTMTAARSVHTATLLPNGTVLITGGKNATGFLSSAEIYDPNTGLFTAAGNMSTPRTGHTATLAGDGSVVIAGGLANGYLNTVEVYENGGFTPVASTMTSARFQHSSAVLPDGSILITGGRNTDLLSFDINFRVDSDNVAPSIIMSADSTTGFVPYSGSGVIVGFSTGNGAITSTINTGGKPVYMTALPRNRFAAVSVLDNRIFIVNMDTLAIERTHTFNGFFGFGSVLTVSGDGTKGYISSTATGSVIKFDIETGAVEGTLTGLISPAQLTLTDDENTLLVVDTTPNEIVFVNTASMTSRFKLAPAGAIFSIYSKPVLHRPENSADLFGLIASEAVITTDLTSLSPAYIFRVFNNGGNAEVVSAVQLGATPGFTTLLPDKSAWLVLGANSLNLISTSDFASSRVYQTYKGNPLGSANVLITPDSRYAYYTSGSDDFVFQHDLKTAGVIGSILVGDQPDSTQDQPSTLAFTPDGKVMAVLNFMSNSLDLLVDSTLLRQTKFVSQGNKFTGLSIVNLSATPTKVSVRALTNTGTLFTEFENPKTWELGPNEQQSYDVSELFGFSGSVEPTGRIEIESSQPTIAAFSATGEVRPEFLSSYTSSLQGIPFYPDHKSQLHDYIIPEISMANGTTVELNMVNPNYNVSPYNLTHYGTDGSVLETKFNAQLSGAVREVKGVKDHISSTADSGRVLLVGGSHEGNTQGTAEVFQPDSRSFEQTDSLDVARQGVSATLMTNEKVLIAGGKNESEVLKTAVLFDSVTRRFTRTAGTMTTERFRHTATVLLDGKVLIAGGQNAVSISNTAELFDPATEGFTPTAGPMTSARDSHTATRLSDGTVLITGGIDGVSISGTAEIYSPITNRFTATGPMAAARAFHTTVLLRNGTVLVTGGYNGNYLDSTEIYDPATRTFSPGPSMVVQRSGHTATILNDGRILITGGTNSSGAINVAEMYDPLQGRFVRINDEMASPRVWHTATLISRESENVDDVVLIAGGSNGSESVNSIEIFDPVTLQFTEGANDMTSGRQRHAAVALRGHDQGYLRIQTSVGALFTEIFDNGGTDASLNAIDMTKFAGKTTVYSPQFTTLENYPSFVNIINGNQEAATVTLTLHGADGSILGTPVTATMPKNSQIKGSLWSLFQNDPALLGQTGWLEVSSDKDMIVGIISFTNPSNTFLASFELSATPLSTFVFPLVSQDPTYATELSLLNANSTAATVQLELWGLAPGTTPVATTTITLQPNSHRVATVSELFPGQTHRTANVRVFSNQPLHSFAILSDTAARFISSVPPVEMTGTPASVDR